MMTMETKLRAFPLVMKGEARRWYQTLSAERRANWETLKECFLQKFGAGSTPEELWQQLTILQQVSLQDYTMYEAKFNELWGRWVISLGEGGAAPDFLKRDCFLAGLYAPLQEKVRSHFPASYEESVAAAHLKDRKLCFQHRLGQAASSQGGVESEAPSTLHQDVRDLTHQFKW